MHDVMEEERLTQPEFNIDRMFTVTPRKSFDFEKWIEKLTNNRVKIIRKVHNNPKVIKR